MSISLRIKELREKLNLNKAVFSTSLNVDSSQYSKIEAEKLQPTISLLMEISSIYKVDANWLLNGEGSMLKTENKTSTDKVEVVQNNQKGIPLVKTTAIGGFGNSQFSIEQRDVKDFYKIPKFDHKQVDFMIEVEGSSMYPKYNSGDVVACRIIKEDRFIQWNKTHVIATKDQGIIIKRIKQGSDNNLLMVSDNKDYDPFEVTHDDIDGIALVVGVIRLE
jgi:repressor LexA